MRHYIDTSVESRVLEDGSEVYIVKVITIPRGTIGATLEMDTEDSAYEPEAFLRRHLICAWDVNEQPIT